MAMSSSIRSGSIPAWAGEPRTSGMKAGRGRVYPRVGGGTVTLAQSWPSCRGLSPRGRGNRGPANCLALTRGSIPAWAGEPRTWTTNIIKVRVYPRVGGGTANGRRRCRKSSGLSPRGRGNLDMAMSSSIRSGSIPAWAGEPRTSGMKAGRGRVYPRVGGGTVTLAQSWPSCRGLSPRGRGNRNFGTILALLPRSIPAWAGEPGRSPPKHLRRSVYPRVGGGTEDAKAAQHSEKGLSPRGRGNRAYPKKKGTPKGSIPAWAGEPLGLQLIQSRREVYPRVGGGTAIRGAVKG